jgi:hypothetical protein
LARGHHVPEGILSARAAFGAGVLLLLLASGCGLFETRTPTKPPGGSLFTCLTLDAQDNVYLNVQRAYGRGDGLGCYVSTLDDNAFRFHPDPTDSSEQGAQFVNWDKSVEETVSNAIIGAVDSIYLQLKLPYEAITVQPDVETRKYAYEIETVGGAIADTLFQGVAEITIRRGSGGAWQITDWYDRRDPNGTTSRTWGYLRGSYRIVAP